MITIPQLSAAILVMSLASCSPPKPETFIPKIQQEGEIFLNAISSGNEAVASRLMPPGYLKIIDGEVGAYLRKRTNGFRENSFAITGASVGVPQVPQSVDGMLISFVPATSQAEYDDGGSIGQTRLFGPTSITISTYLVAVSSDKGKTWAFFEAEPDRSTIDLALPSTIGKLVIPAKLVNAIPN